MSEPTRSITSAMRLTMDSSRPASTAARWCWTAEVAFGVGDEAAERQRVDIAIGDQPRALEDEGDLRVLGQVGIELGDHRGGQIQRAGFLIEAAGRLDLAHFLARRHVDREEFLDLLFFRDRRLEQIEPDCVGRHGLRRTLFAARQPERIRQEDAQHVEGASALFGRCEIVEQGQQTDCDRRPLRHRWSIGRSRSSAARRRRDNAW